MKKKIYTVEEIKAEHGKNTKIPAIYDYSKTLTSCSSEKITITCLKHGDFTQVTRDHMQGAGCKKCAMEWLTENRGGRYNRGAEGFVEDGRKQFGERFSYDKVHETYVNRRSLCLVHCNRHDIDFMTSAIEHMRAKSSGGCPECFREICSNRLRSNTEEFIQRAKAKYGEDRFMYEKTNYIGKEDPLIVTCPEHGDFTVRPHVFLSSRVRYGCPECTRLGVLKERRKTTEQFIKDAVSVHGDKYDYSESNYKTAYTDVKIICHEKYANGEEHGEFWQTPHNHLHGQGCPKCKKWKMEADVMLELRHNNIKFVHQESFSWLGRQTIDVFVPNKSIAVECQGLQHFVPVDFGNLGEEWTNQRFEYVKELDEKKRRLCAEHGITLVYYLKEEYKEEAEKTGIPTFTTLDDLLNFIKSSPNVSAIEKDSVSLQQN